MGHGRSVCGLPRGAPGSTWRPEPLAEPPAPDPLAGDPSVTAPPTASPPIYEAIRTTVSTYVEYSDGSREYYDRTTDPHELHNIVKSLSPVRLGQLHTALTNLQNCHNGTDCWAAGHVTA